MGEGRDLCAFENIIVSSKHCSKSWELTEINHLSRCLSNPHHRHAQSLCHTLTNSVSLSLSLPLLSSSISRLTLTKLIFYFFFLLPLLLNAHPTFHPHFLVLVSKTIYVGSIKYLLLHHTCEWQIWYSSLKENYHPISKKKLSASSKKHNTHTHTHTHTHNLKKQRVKRWGEWSFRSRELRTQQAGKSLSQKGEMDLSRKHMNFLFSVMLM